MIPAPAFFRELFEYVRWGDHECLLAARSVSDQEYFREQPISHGSLHKQLVHMMVAEWLWLSRWRGSTNAKAETVEDYPTRMAVEQRWPLVHAALLDFVAHQTPSSLARNVTYRTSRGDLVTLPLASLMIHVIDHAAYHRGQLNTMIRRAGGQPRSISFHAYSLQKEKHW